MSDQPLTPSPDEFLDALEDELHARQSRDLQAGGGGHKTRSLMAAHILFLQEVIHRAEREAESE